LSSNAKYQARAGAHDGFEELREITARGHHERQPLGLGMLSSYLDDLRLDIAVVGFLAAWLSPCTLALDNSAGTAVAIFAESTLYRAAVRATLLVQRLRCVNSAYKFYSGGGVATGGGGVGRGISVVGGGFC
jgi:hypothetical protein